MAAILDVCCYHGPYPGTFIPSLIAVGDAVRQRLGLEHVLVFPEDVRDRPWVDLLRGHGYDPLFLPAARSIRGDAAQLAAIAERVDARLIRTHFTFFDIPAALAGRRRGARVIWHVHSERQMSGDVWRQRLKDLVKYRLLGRALCHRLIAVSDGIGRDVQSRGLQARKVSVVLNGIDVSRFATLPDRTAERRRLRLLPGEPVALAFCWLPELKGAHTVAAACADAGFVALMVGGPDLEAFLAPVPSHVRIIPPEDDPRGLYAAADAFVSASSSEGMPYSVGEAMAARLPVASSRIAAAAPYFGAPGVETFAVRDAVGLAGALERILQPGSRDQRGEGNRDFVARNLSLERYVDCILGIFSGELAQAPRRRRDPA
jgi:glycosyltransferase involved in cell wall biosynthesis